MSEHASFERFVADRFAEVERGVPPARFIDDILIEARRMRPLPRWLATIKEPPMRISSRVAVGSPIARVVSLTIVVVILAALTAGGIAVGATLLTSPAPSGPLALVVAQDGAGDFTTISEAVAAARGGDTVRVRPGTYLESIMITRDIVIEGDGPAGSVVIEFTTDSPTVDSVIGGDVPYGIALDGADPHVSNLTVHGPAAGTAVWVKGGAPTLEGISVVLTGELGRWMPLAFELLDGTTATLRDATGSWFIAIGGGASPTIEGLVQEGGGFITGPGTKPHIRDSTFGFALDVDGRAEPTIERNHLLGVKVIAGAPVIRDNVIGNPDFVAGAVDVSSEEVTAIEIAGGSPLIVGNRITDHEVGISVGPGSAPTIQDNRIEANTAGIVVSGARTTPILSGNTFCDNGTDLVVPTGSAVTLDGNAVCEPGSSVTP